MLAAGTRQWKGARPFSTPQREPSGAGARKPRRRTLFPTHFSRQDAPVILHTRLEQRLAKEADNRIITKLQESNLRRTFFDRY